MKKVWLEKTNSIEMKEAFLYDIQLEYIDNQRVINERKELEKEASSLYVLKDDNQILGYLVCRDEGDRTVCFHHVFIKNNFRGNGYGKLLIKEGIKLVKDEGYTKVVLAARNGKEQFYVKCGFANKGLLQLDKEKANKDDIESFLKKFGIKNYEYKLWNDKVHQFYFKIEKNIMDMQFYDECRAKGYNFNVLFTKEIEN